MAARKFLAFLLCALLFVPAAMIALSPDRAVSSFPDWTSFRNGSAAERIEQAVTEVFPGAHRLSDLTASIQTAQSAPDLKASRIAWNFAQFARSPGCGFALVRW